VRGDGVAGEPTGASDEAVLEVMDAVLCVDEELLKSTSIRPEELNVLRDDKRIGSSLSPSEIRSL
jgi:hypothetical protein